MTKVSCPTCGATVEWIPENVFRPFCGERCKLIDLGEWASESYRVPAEQPGDFVNGEATPLPK